jgi:hypothetical protein
MENVEPTVENLSANPCHFLPALSFMIQSIERIKGECEDSSHMPRLFALLPCPSLKWKYISLNDKALASNTRQSEAKPYEDKVKLFYNVFDFRKFGFER